MAFEWIQAESRPWIAAATTPEASAVDADRAAATLRRDYERWSRAALGLLAFALTTVGSFIAVGMWATMAASPRLALSDIGVVATAILITVVGAAILTTLWVTGRRLLRATAWWLRLPYVEGTRHRRAAGWVRARTVNFEPPIFVRIDSGTLAALLAVGGISAYWRDVAESQAGPLSLAALTVGAVSLLCALGQVGGVIRLVSGLSEADPLWARIRSSFRGS